MQEEKKKNPRKRFVKNELPKEEQVFMACPFTDMDSGQSKYGGWNKDGIKRFKELSELIRAGRDKDGTPDLEQKLLTAVREQEGIKRGDPKEEKKAKRHKKNDDEEVVEIEFDD